MTQTQIIQILAGFVGTIGFAVLFNIRGKRLVAAAKENFTAIDATCGKKTRTVIVMDSGHIVMSAKEPESIEPAEK